MGRTQPALGIGMAGTALPTFTSIARPGRLLSHGPQELDGDYFMENPNLTWMIRMGIVLDDFLGDYW